MAHLTVILCKKCGTRNEATAEFCGGCGSYLEFTGVKVEEGAGAPAGAPAAAPPSPPAPAAAPAPPPPAAVPAPVGGTSAGAPPPPPPQTPSAAPAAIPAAPAAVRPTDGPPAVSPLAAHQAPPAIKPGAPQPGAGEPAQRRPTDQVPKQARPQTPPPVVPQVVAKAGDIICGYCGTPNDPSRHFCRNCGRSLLAAAPVKKEPWWRRFFKKKEPVAAGTRTESHTKTVRAGSGFGRTFRSVLALVFVALMTFGLAGYIAVPTLRGTINNVIKDFSRNFAQPTHVYPTGAAGDAIKDHPPEFAIDKSHNRYWAGPISGSLPSLDFAFAAPTDIVAVIVSPGAEDDLAAFARPKELRFTFSDGTVLDATLADATLVDAAPGQGTGKVVAGQTFNTNAREITGVTVQVMSFYQGTRPAVAIAEIEFFTK